MSSSLTAGMKLLTQFYARRLFAQLFLQKALFCDRNTGESRITNYK